MTAARRQAEFLGRVAEHIVAWLYRLQGYRLLHRRYRSSYGEIDLIMRRRRSIVFIEVKYRSSADPLDLVLPTHHQQQRIRTTAKQFISHHPVVFDGHRFDVVVITGWRKLRVFTHAW